MVTGSELDNAIPDDPATDALMNNAATIDSGLQFLYRRGA